VYATLNLVRVDGLLYLGEDLPQHAEVKVEPTASVAKMKSSSSNDEHVEGLSDDKEDNNVGKLQSSEEEEAENEDEDEEDEESSIEDAIGTVVYVAGEAESWM
jgi:hypothetical protein